MTHRQPFQLYKPAEIFLLRAPAFSASLFQRLSSLKGGNAAVSLSLLTDPHNIRAAIALANPSLFQSLQHREQKKEGTRRMKKAISTLMRYVIRMSTRPTPFGLFSGVAIGRFGETTTLQLTSPVIQQVRLRSDMEWLTHFIHKRESDPSIFTQCPLFWNQLAYRVGDRLYLPDTKPEQAVSPQSLSLQASPIVMAIMAITQIPTTYQTLY